MKWCKLQAKSKFYIFQNLWIKFREAASSANAQTKTPGVQTSGSKGPELANVERNAEWFNLDYVAGKLKNMWM